jgi:GNAT superfamily N-acetyltransferase
MENNNLMIEFKRVGIDYLEILVDLRIEFIKDIHPELDTKLLEKIYKTTLKYFKELFENKAYIGFIGLLNNEVICTAGLLLYNLPPLTNESYRKIGHVLNFYTKSGYRKKGYGLKLMEYIKKIAMEEKINRLVLNSTQMGFSIYKEAGFIEPEDKAMILELNK